MADSTSDPQRQFSNHLFREIYKNAWLNKVISQNCDKSPVTPGVFWSMPKPERYWIVFCIHDDTEAYLEAYTDGKMSLLHRPTWFTNLNNVHHISPTICSEFNEYEFAITISSEVLRLLAPTREAMVDWVDTMRTKLTEMHILSPCKNMYTALPQLKSTPLLPTRDPTSPLPPPPTVPTVIPPGTELSNPRNSSNEEEGSSTNCDIRESDVSTELSSQRNALRRNLLPNPPSVVSEPYVTVIQVAETTEAIRTETRPVIPVPAISTESNSQISNRPRYPEPNDEERPVATSITIDSCQHCVAGDSTSCTHYGIVYVQDIKSNENTQSRDSPNVISNVANKDTTNRSGHSNLVVDSSRNGSSPSTSETPNISRLEIRDNTIPTTSRNLRTERNDEVHSSSNYERFNDEVWGLPRNMMREATLTLREQQVLRLQKEIMHPCGVRIQLSPNDCNNAIALVDAFGAVWVAGWKQNENPRLYILLHIGDQIQAVDGIRVNRAADAYKLLQKTANSRFIPVIIRRVPYGRVFAIQREVEGQSLGIVQEQNTAEIKEVIPNSLVAKHGLSQRTPTHNNLAFTNWVLTEINGRPLNLFSKDNEVRDRLNAIGLEISILVQPLDLIKQIKKQLKSMKNYKDYIVE